MEYVLIAIAVMMTATIAVHTALPQAVSSVVAKVSKCHKCLTFWSALVVLLAARCHVVIAVLLSLGASYVSNWFGLLLIWLNRKYNELWQRVNRPKRK